MPKAMPGPGWHVDVFTYEQRDPERKGILFLAWNGSDSWVKYADARTGKVTPWHGWWAVSPESSHRFGVSVKERLTRTVYFSWPGDEGNVQPLYLGLGLDTDLFIGIDFEDRPAFVQPLSHVGRGFEFTSAELAAVFASIERRGMISRFAALLSSWFPRSRM